MVECVVSFKSQECVGGRWEVLVSRRSQTFSD